MGIITKGMGIILKKGDNTIKSVKPTLGKKETTTYKFRMAKDKLSKNMDKLKQLKGKKWEKTIDKALQKALM